MTRIYATVQTQTPAQRVFDHATTPGNWPEWHGDGEGREQERRGVRARTAPSICYLLFYGPIIDLGSQ